jgi:DNA-binding XRE family transcriptional regulator
MKKRKPIAYLRAYRLRWGLSQIELAELLGWRRTEVISRVERKQ